MTTDADEVTNETTETYNNAGPTLSRRRFGQALVISATATAAGSSVSGTVAAEEDWTLADDQLGGLLSKPGGVALDYVMGSGYVQEASTRIANYGHLRFGDMRDYGDYTGGDALASEVAIGAQQMSISDESVLTGLNNNIEAADNVAYAKGQIAIAEAMDAGKSESDAQADMQAAIDEHFGTIQENLVNHHNTQIKQTDHTWARVDEHTDVLLSDVFRLEYYFADGTYDSTKTPDEYNGLRDANTFETLDGRTLTTYAINVSYEGITETHKIVGMPFADPFEGGTEGDFLASVALDQSDGTEYRQHASERYDVNQRIIERRDAVNADLSGYVTDVYAAYEPGDVDASTLIDPTTFATELSTDNNRGFRRAAAESLGIPTNAEESVVIQIHPEDGDGGYDLTTGEIAEVDFYTNHTPTDTEGNPVGFEVGETYEPQNWDELFYIGYTTESGSEDMATLESPFTITEAFDTDGNDIQTFEPDATQTHTSDVEQYQEELEAMRDRQLELQEQYEDQQAGGATADDSWTTRQMAVVGGVVAAALAGVGLAAGGS